MSQRKSSCVANPENEPLVLIRKWQITFCENNHCAAALLSLFIYWHDIRLQIIGKNKKANDIAEAHGDGRTQDESTLQFHTTEELIEGLLGLFGKSAINEAIKLLHSLKIIIIHRNPNKRYKFDRTRYFQFHPEVVNEWLNNRYVTEFSHSLKTTDRAIEFSQRENSTDEVHTQKIETHDVVQSTNNHKNDIQPIDLIDSSEIANRAFENKNSIHTPSEYALLKNSSPSTENSRPITEITAKNKTKAAAAKRTCADNSPNVIDNKTPQLAAAAFFDDAMIGKTLTEQQRTFVKQTVIKLKSQTQLSNSVASLCQEVEAVLLDPSCFKKTGNDFHYKLNVIKKTIRDGKWTTPVELTKENKQPAASNQTHPTNPLANKITAIQQQLESLQIECRSFEAAIRAYPDEKAYVQSHRDAMIKKRQTIEALKTELHDLQLNHQPQLSQGGGSHDECMH